MRCSCPLYDTIFSNRLEISISWAAKLSMNLIMFRSCNEIVARGGPMHSSSVQYVSPRGDRATRVACVQVGGQGGRTDKPRTTVGLRKGAGGSGKRERGGTECRWACESERTRWIVSPWARVSNWKSQPGDPLSHHEIGKPNGLPRRWFFWRVCEESLGAPAGEF